MQQLVQFATTGIAFADFLLGKGNGKFDPEVFLPLEVAGSRPELVDLDGDGRPELLLSSQARAGIALLRNMHSDP